MDVVSYCFHAVSRIESTYTIVLTLSFDITATSLSTQLLIIPASTSSALESFLEAYGKLFLKLIQERNRIETLQKVPTVKAKHPVFFAIK